jgi:hypothetical protein
VRAGTESKACPSSTRISDPACPGSEVKIETEVNIYCDTNTLFNNINNEPTEQAAIKRLLAARLSGIVMYRSLVDLREVMDTVEVMKRRSLVADYEQLKPITKDEKVYGFHGQADQYGGFVSNPLVSDVQDEAVCRELEQRGLERRDAQHITQAVCNDCDVFLTRDRKTIISPHRSWLENRFPRLKIRLPSELATELGV